MNTAIDIINFLNSSDDETLTIANRAIDILIDMFSKSVIQNDSGTIDDMIEGLSTQISKKYNELSIDKSMVLNQAFYLGILNAFNTIAEDISEKIKFYMNIVNDIQEDDYLIDLLSLLSQGPTLQTVVISSLENTTFDNDISIKKYVNKKLINSIEVGENNIYMLTSEGVDAYNISINFDSAARRYKNLSELSLDLLENVANAMENYSNKNNAIADIVIKSKSINKYDHFTNFKIRNRLNRIFTTFETKTREHHELGVYDGYIQPRKMEEFVTIKIISKNNSSNFADYLKSGGNNNEY